MSPDSDISDMFLNGEKVGNNFLDPGDGQNMINVRCMSLSICPDS